MKTAILFALTLTTNLLATGCATDEDLPEDGITLESSDESGKADTINGTKLRLRGPSKVIGNYTFDQPKLVTVDVNTAETTIATGEWYGIGGGEGGIVPDSTTWYGDKLLQADIEGPDGVMMGIVARSNFTEKLNCRRGAVRRNVFTSLAINLRAKEIYVDGEFTFTFAECGFKQARTDFYWLELFAIPLHTTGEIEGTYEYRLDVSVD